jgi:hypothetical protein
MVSTEGFMGSCIDPNLKHAEDEADRLIAQNGLVHPMTLPAAMRVVSSHGIGQLTLMEAIAKHMVEKLKPNDHPQADRLPPP